MKVAGAAELMKNAAPGGEVLLNCFKRAFIEPLVFKRPSPTDLHQTSSKWCIHLRCRIPD